MKDWFDGCELSWVWSSARSKGCSVGLYTGTRDRYWSGSLNMSKPVFLLGLRKASCLAVLQWEGMLSCGVSILTWEACNVLCHSWILDPFSALRKLWDWPMFFAVVMQRFDSSNLNVVYFQSYRCITPRMASNKGGSTRIRGAGEGYLVGGLACDMYVREW